MVAAEDVRDVVAAELVKVVSEVRMEDGRASRAGDEVLRFPMTPVSQRALRWGWMESVATESAFY